jgi:hypothetical protein
MSQSFLNLFMSYLLTRNSRIEEDLINFCLFNKYRLRRRSELLEFLSAPSDQLKLGETISLYRKRLRSLKKRATR